ncbi:MAG: OB-fold domain-containing protein [Acidimicrobiia bacterium]|nr:OB-fold domain-containing protein [Acidimicrobiia bacterium]
MTAHDPAAHTGVDPAAPGPIPDDPDEFLALLRAAVGRAGTPQPARDPVSLSTIRAWCDAMSEANPLYTDPEAAAVGPHAALVAPPAMLNVWTMAGLVSGAPIPRDPNEPRAKVYELLDRGGFPGVVAVNSDLSFERYLRLGEHITATTRLVAVSEQKTTRLGIGHFVTTEAEFVDDAGDRVGALSFKVLRYRPTAKDVAGDEPPAAMESPAERPPRPRPKFNQDQAWFWEGLRHHELRIQRFTDDGSLVHPPANCNPQTQHFDYDWIVAGGRATLYSHTVVHYPQVPSFDYPHIVGLVELEEGVRLVTTIVGCTPEQLEIGMPLELDFVDSADDVTLHQFHPARSPRAASAPEHVAIGDRLPLCPIPIDTLLVVSTAIATRDYQEVHHDVTVAQSRGSIDIFMNILTTSGLVQRWIGDWAGDGVVFKNLKIGLGVPNHPGDIMTMSGAVSAIADDGTITIGYIGRNALGAHVTGTADIALPDSDAHSAVLVAGAAKGDPA